jgi:hypothetical protein
VRVGVRLFESLLLLGEKSEVHRCTKVVEQAKEVEVLLERRTAVKKQLIAEREQGGEEPRSRYPHKPYTSEKGACGG